MESATCAPTRSLMLVVEGSEEATATERGRRVNYLRGGSCREH